MKYVKGDLFGYAPKGSVLVHSCNCYGSWGAGIATQFRQRFPQAYFEYQKTCAQTKAPGLLGKTLLVEENGFLIASLFVSSGYGSYKDSEEDILKNTRASFLDLALQIRPLRRQVHMPKINSGLFRVKWQKTEHLIMMYLEPSTMGVTVYDL